MWLLLCLILGQNMRTEEVARIAVMSAVRYHRDKKEANGDVSSFIAYLLLLRIRNIIFLQSYLN